MMDHDGHMMVVVMMMMMTPFYLIQGQ